MLRIDVDERLVAAKRPNLCKIVARKCALGRREELHLLDGGGHQMRLLWDNSNPLMDHFGNLFAESYLNILYETG